MKNVFAPALLTGAFVLLLSSFISFPTADADRQALMVADWERAKAYTLEYIEAMPAESMNFKPTPEMRSFAEQMLHLTTANGGFVAQALNENPNIPNLGQLEKDESLKNKEALTKVVTQGYDFVIASLKDVDAERLNEQVNLFGQFEMTIAEAMEKAFEHQTHHRGQTTVYLRLSGVTPPSEKLF